MKNSLKWTALAMVGALAATAASAAQPASGNSCRYSLGAAERVVALNAISNLMGRYSHLGGLRGEDTLQSLFAMKQPDVSWRSPTGPQGPDAMRARFRQPGEAPRPEVPGELHVHAMLTPVIEVAADGKTAKGVWDSFGPNINNGNEVGNWLWVKYAVDFIKEDGQWKIWHLQVYALFNTPYDKSITQSAWERANPAYASRPGTGTTTGARVGGAPAAPAAASPAPAPAAAPAWSGPKDMWVYDGKTSPRGPYIPEPYCTFDPATSYGRI